MKSKEISEAYPLGSKVWPVGLKPLMAATSNKVGVSMQHFKWRLLVQAFDK